MRKFHVLIIVIILFFTVPAVWGADFFRVKLEISSPDDMVRIETISAMKSEFRRLEDVSIVDDGDVDFVVQIGAMELADVQGRVTGVAYSTVLFSPFKKGLFNIYLSSLTEKEFEKIEEKPKTHPRAEVPEKKLTKEEQERAGKLDMDLKMLDEWAEQNKWATDIARQYLGPKSSISRMTDNLVRIHDHKINLGSRSDIRSICRSIVASIDVNHLEEQRRQRAESNELWNNLSKPFSLKMK